jgi:hypothetical protein
MEGLAGGCMEKQELEESQNLIYSNPILLAITLYEQTTFSAWSKRRNFKLVR